MIEIAGYGYSKRSLFYDTSVTLIWYNTLVKVIRRYQTEVKDMKLIGGLKKKVENAQIKQEANDDIMKAGMKNADHECK